MDKIELLNKLEKARLKYKPEKVKLLLIAEAAPDSFERFFYYEKVKEKDFLFLALSEYFYPTLKENYLASKRNEIIKQEILTKFQQDGIYLIDLYDLPISINYLTENEAVKRTLEKVKYLANEETNIITIKANVYDSLSHKLKIYNHIDIKIPFPSSGQQGNFRIKFDEAIKKACR